MWLFGCTSGATVQLEGDFPTPLVVPAPVHVGLVLEPALTQYVFEEKLERGGEWRLELGEMQPKLFRTVFGAVFAQVTEVADVAAGAQLDGVLVPVIDKLQIAVPTQTRSEFYEVWIRYLIRLYDPAGQLIVEWPLTAYGKASKDDYGFLEKADEPGMTAAANTAMRDAGAFLAIRFTSAREVAQWLAGRQAEGTSP
ncbi:MAG: hypothetical protein HC809_13895 [Gammaproteobacteria bacterium]|nr:hypothetical protein [Gammaproteobacteria bacterium]